MRMYAGITDNPNRRKQEHGNPSDWQVLRSFSNEKEARDWVTWMHQAGYYGAGRHSPGWLFGYTYTITPETHED